MRGGWEGHQPVEATEEFIPFLREQGFTVRVEESPKVYADAGVMAGVDLVVQCTTMSTIAREEVAGLRAAVEAGTGLAGWHGGIADSYRDNSDYLQLIGGQFACHPARTPGERTGEQSDFFVPYQVEITPAGAVHPVTEGVADFALTTEQYWVLTDDYNDVLATTTVPVLEWGSWHRPVTSPAVWTRRWGAGRVFVCTPGHSVEVLREPSVRRIVERGLLWASR